MSVKFINIVRDIAEQYPQFSSEDITNFIIESIESDALIIQAVSNLKIPNAMQIRQAEFLSKRLRSTRISKEFLKQKTRIIDHIDNANFLNKINSSYVFVSPKNSSQPNNYVPFETGSQVTRAMNFSNTNMKLPLVHNSSTFNISSLPKDLKTQATELTAQDANVTRTADEATRPLFNALKIIQQQIDDGNMLSLSNAEQLAYSIEFCSDDNNLLNLVLTIVRTDIRLRNKTLGIDTLKTLYEGEDLIPPTMQVEKPKISTTLDTICELLKAIVVVEYKRLHEFEGSRFINSDITYDEYCSSTFSYAAYSDKIYSEVDHVC